MSEAQVTVEEGRASQGGKRALVAFFAGAVFALGLGISGMTLPQKVIGFLDVTGDWDGSLAFVMGGAVVVMAIAYRLRLRMQAPAFDARFHLPTRRDLDARLLTGAALFGVGWGLGGLCPGPAIVSGPLGFTSGMGDVLVFLASMLGGMFLLKGLERFTAGRGAEQVEPQGVSAPPSSVTPTPSA